MIPYFSNDEKLELNEISDLIKSEVNVKKIELISNSSGILVKKVKPNFKTLGPKLGKTLSLATVIIKDFNNNDIQKIENGESITIVVNSEMITLESTDLEVVSEDIEGCLVASESNITVALDITLNEELINEGICRELINRIQNLRKETGLLVTDKINLKIQKDNIIEKAIFENKAYILSETLTQNLEFVNVLNEGLEIKFDNINTKISINKIS